MNTTPIQKRKNFLEEMLMNGEFEQLPVIEHAPPQFINPKGGGTVNTPPIFDREPFEFDETKPVRNPVSKPAMYPNKKPPFIGGRINPIRFFGQKNPFFNAMMF